MVYIFGKLLNKKKLVRIALKSVFGLGLFQIKLLCNKCHIGLNCKIKDLSQTQIVNICRKIDQNKLLIESHLKNIIRSDITRLITIKSFRGFFHKKLKNVSKK
jgi:ribosomal protein S13